MTSNPFDQKKTPYKFVSIENSSYICYVVKGDTPNTTTLTKISTQPSGQDVKTAVKIMIRNSEMKKEVLAENFAIVEGCTFNEYVQLESDSDPDFFRWLFDDYYIEDFGVNMTEEQKEEFKRFIDSL